MKTALARILDDLKRNGGLKGTDIANIVDVSPSTVTRWSAGDASPQIEVQTVISDLRYVVDRLRDFYEPDEARLWLHARHPMLSDERAIDLIRRGETKTVLEEIERLEAGAYV